MTEITTEQSNQLELLAALSYDTAATKIAVEFIQNNPFKHRLFIQQYNRLLTLVTLNQMSFHAQSPRCKSPLKRWPSSTLLQQPNNPTGRAQAVSVSPRQR